MTGERYCEKARMMLRRSLSLGRVVARALPGGHRDESHGRRDRRHIEPAELQQQEAAEQRRDDRRDREDRRDPSGAAPDRRRRQAARRRS